MKTVVISTDDNPDYLYYMPIVSWAWKKIGWSVMAMYITSKPTKSAYIAFERFGKHDIVIQVPLIYGYRSATVAQISRLYAAAVPKSYDDLIMTSDGDMLPLSDYWKDHSKPTVYGHDLAGYIEYPISYIQMDASIWRKIMNLNQQNEIEFFIKRDLDAMPNAKSNDFTKWWGVDQQLITKRLSAINPTTINRGTLQNGYPRGRVDRSAWSLNHKEFIDAHLYHGAWRKGNEWMFENIMQLLHRVWPKEDFSWWVEYTRKFREMAS